MNSATTSASPISTTRTGVPTEPASGTSCRSVRGTARREARARRSSARGRRSVSNGSRRCRAVTALEDTPIPAVEQRPFVIRLSVPGSVNEYFLLENREQTGFDVGLPASGLLIWHVDDSQPDNTNDAHRLLDLEEADEGINGDHPTDSGDPWHDTAVGFGPDTRPSSAAYDATATNWRVRDISAAGPTMTATLLFSLIVDVAVQEIRAPPIMALGAAVTAGVVVRNEGSVSVTTSVTVGVYLDRIAANALVQPATRTPFTLSAEASTTVNISFGATSLGRYLIDAVASTPGDLIRTDDERVAHV